jgi:hypothetical protein
MVQDNKPITLAVNTMKAVDVLKREGKIESGQGDIFGFDDSAIREAEVMAARAAKAQREIQQQISSVQGAAKNPKAAAELGVDVRDPKSVLSKIDQLKAEKVRLDNWPNYPDLVAQFKENADLQANHAFELAQETAAQIAFREAELKKARVEESRMNNAPPPEEFNLSGSSSPVDEARAAGQMELDSPPAYKVGDMVKLTKLGVNGRVNIAGTIKSILPDGRLEIKTQNDGYMTVRESELGHK